MEAQKINYLKISIDYAIFKYQDNGCSCPTKINDERTTYPLSGRVDSAASRLRFGSKDVTIAGNKNITIIKRTDGAPAPFYSARP